MLLAATKYRSKFECEFSICSKETNDFYTVDLCDKNDLMNESGDLINTKTLAERLVHEGLASYVHITSNCLNYILEFPGKLRHKN